MNNIFINKNNGIPSFIVDKTLRVRERHHKSIKMFYEAGGKKAMGTDAGTPFNVHGENLQELKFMIDLGVSHKDALKISTLNAAELMGLSDRGKIREGDFADMLIVNGNPLEDIEMVSNSDNHRLVIKNGSIVNN